MYEKLKEINGLHPWRSVSPDAYVDYRARYRDGGRVLYFNYPLAMEMGLIPKDHPTRMTKRLERALLETFSLQIINEHDLREGKTYPSETVKPHPFMATRYLQLQHKNKQGKTSGDGRSIWNGCLKTSRLTFDISSRGTGATILSPGAQQAGEPVPTGENRYGYASGLADLEEMLASAVMSEIFYRQGIPTERSLVVIGFRDGTGIGVRSAPNLIRPAHIFRYLKQGRHAELKASLDYFIKRQIDNGTWELPANGNGKYFKALDYLARSYGKMAAVLEEEYIFNWLAWDGDNMLASGAILDYGSIRQFAAKHNKYRYDDVERFSTCLTEQRYWARMLVQVFAQVVDFVITGEKQSLDNFKEAECLGAFDQSFTEERNWRMLWRLGFTPEQIGTLMRKAQDDVREFRRAMTYFEDLKVSQGIEKVHDGFTHKPIFLIRNLLRELPAFYLEQCGGQEGCLMPPREFCRIMAASYVKKKDLQLTAARAAHSKNFQERYQKLVGALGLPFEKVLKTLSERSAVINYEYRMTGNALIWIIDEVLNVTKKISADELQEALDAFIESQVLIPGKWQPIPPRKLNCKSLKCRLLARIQKNLEEFKESI